MKTQSANMKQYLTSFLREKPFFFSIIRPKEASLYQKLKPFNKPVLDLGCGDGFFAEVAFGKMFAGIDPDKSVIKEAANRKIYDEIKEYDGRKIPYKDNYFSTVVSNSTVEHISNLDEVLSEVSRVMKKGGMFYFTTVTDIWPEYLLGNLLFGDYYKKYFIKKSKHYNMYSLKKWYKKLEKYDLQIIDSQHYLDNKKILRIFDLTHYLSIFSLLTKKILGKWVLLPDKEKLFTGLKKYILKETRANNTIGPYLYIAARKVR